jgi:DNA helicase HerA-like ATPase
LQGRKERNIFIFLTSQSPQDVPDELFGQVATLLVHRLTHKNEFDIIQNHLSVGSLKQVPKLNRGKAILTSINLLRELQLSITKYNRAYDSLAFKL